MILSTVFKRYKAEGVCGVVGDFVILEFDIDKSYLEFEQNGTRCKFY